MHRCAQSVQIWQRSNSPITFTRGISRRKAIYQPNVLTMFFDAGHRSLLYVINHTFSAVVRPSLLYLTVVLGGVGRRRVHRRISLVFSLGETCVVFIYFWFNVTAQSPCTFLKCPQFSNMWRKFSETKFELRIY